MPIPGIVARLRRVTAPTLIVTGEPALDRVVPVEGTAAYVELIRGATHVVLERTGHLGTITRPQAFADAVNEFVEIRSAALQSHDTSGVAPAADDVRSSA